MMGHRQELDGIGSDAVAGWRRLLYFRAGERSYAKTRLNRKERRTARQAVKKLTGTEI
jgi:hypothetical protein